MYLAAKPCADLHRRSWLVPMRLVRTPQSGSQEVRLFPLDPCVIGQCYSVVGSLADFLGLPRQVRPGLTPRRRCRLDEDGVCGARGRDHGPNAHPPLDDGVLTGAAGLHINKLKAKPKRSRTEDTDQEGRGKRRGPPLPHPRAEAKYTHSSSFSRLLS